MNCDAKVPHFGCLECPLPFLGSFERIRPWQQQGSGELFLALASGDEAGVRDGGRVLVRLEESWILPQLALVESLRRFSCPLLLGFPLDPGHFKLVLLLSVLLLGAVKVPVPKLLDVVRLMIGRAACGSSRCVERVADVFLRATHCRVSQRHKLVVSEDLGLVKLLLQHVLWVSRWPVLPFITHVLDVALEHGVVWEEVSLERIEMLDVV